MSLRILATVEYCDLAINDLDTVEDYDLVTVEGTELCMDVQAGRLLTENN